MKTRVNSNPFTTLLQQKNYLPWLLYGQATLLVLLLQTAPNFILPVFHARPIPLVSFVICVAVLGGARTGVTVGVLAGILWGVFSFRTFALDALVLMLFGLTVGLLVEWYLRANFYTAMLLCAGGVALYVLLEWFFCYVIFQKENLSEILFKVLLPNGIYTLVVAPLVYMFCYLIARFIRRRANT